MLPNTLVFPYKCIKNNLPFSPGFYIHLDLIISDFSTLTKLQVLQTLRVSIFF